VIGQMPRYKPRQPPQRTPSYTPKRCRKAARRPVAVNTGSMLFDRRELPVATLLSPAGVRTLPVRLRVALAVRWQWLRPRTLPVLVAMIGMFALLASANYLQRLATKTPPQKTIQLAGVADMKTDPAAQRAMIDAWLAGNR
jgi:hypothetical protein